MEEKQKPVANSVINVSQILNQMDGTLVTIFQKELDFPSTKSVITM